MTTRRTVDSKAGTLKTMSKMTGKSAVAKLFTFAAMGLMAVSTMSFIQKDDSATGNENLVAKNTEVIMSDSNADVVTSRFDRNRAGKVVLSEDFVNALRNIKLEVAKADREVVNSLHRSERAKKNAVVFYRNSESTMTAADAEVSEAMKFEALKYNFYNGNNSVIEAATEEVSEHMMLAAVKMTVDAAMKADMTGADEEVMNGVTEKSPETAVANFMKSTSKNIAAADAEISNNISVKNTVVRKK